MFISGNWYYGRVDGYGDEYLATRFYAVQFIPLFPRGAMWVERRHSDTWFGYPTRMSAKSVAATYLRWWAPIIAAIVLIVMGPAGLVVGGPLLALTGWSWTWRRIGSKRERRRAAFHVIAFGTPCDPIHRIEADCEKLRPVIAARFEAVSNGRSPEDVARLGAETPLQAALAYASLRLVAVTAGDATATKARAAAERILDGAKDSDASDLAAGPYRKQPDAAAAVDVAGAAIETAAAATIRERDRARVEAERSSPNSPDNPEVKAEIAANKAKRKNVNRLAYGACGVVLAGVIGWTLYQQRMKDEAAEGAMNVLRTFHDDLCQCKTRACTTQIVDERLESADRAAAAAHKDDSNDAQIRELGEDAQRCIDAVRDR